MVEVATAETKGSSPRERGAPRTRGLATAGVRDHPRVSGEHVSDPHIKTRSEGSSPRERGARSDTLIHLIDLGIIPA